MNTDGTSLVNISNRAANERLPIISPGGSSVLFSSDQSGTGQIYLSDISGAGKVKLSTGINFDIPNSWPHSDVIGFTSLRDGDEEVYALSLLDLSEFRITDNPAVDEGGVISISPDGSKIAFMLKA